MKPGLNPGDRSLLRMSVRDSHLVPQLFPESGPFADLPPVFATAQMIALMEWACLEQMLPYQDEGEVSVGVHVDVDHTAATLSGQLVTVETEVESVEGRFIWFKVVAHDGIDQIGAGRHRRAVIDKTKFMERLADKGVAAGLEG